MSRYAFIALLSVFTASTSFAQLGRVQPTRAEDRPVTLVYSAEMRNWTANNRNPLYPVTEAAFDTLAGLDKSQQYSCLILKATSKGNGSWGASESRDLLLISINCGN